MAAARALPLTRSSCERAHARSAPDRRRRQQFRRASLERPCRCAGRPLQARRRASLRFCSASFRAPRRLPIAPRRPMSLPGQSSHQSSSINWPRRFARPDRSKSTGCLQPSSNRATKRSGSSCLSALSASAALRGLRGRRRQNSSRKVPGRRSERDSDAPHQNQRRCGQAESPARAALAHALRRRHPPGSARLPQ